MVEELGNVRITLYSGAFVRIFHPDVLTLFVLFLCLDLMHIECFIICVLSV